MKEHQKITEADIQEARVVLRPILGVKPRVYVSVLTAILGLAILFMILVYPGIANPRVMLVFAGNPQNAAVLVDGRYAGNTTDGVRVMPGSHELEIRKKGLSL
ncbi:MAG: PEGA domain-containing protein, partial [Rectinema sp.]|nr:PEGA domain-containing protein [Rectinema sp.]